MPRHWFIPIKASDANQRKKDVQDGLSKHGAADLQGFWKTPDGNQLYALVQTSDVSHDLLRDIGANGRPMPLEDV